MTYEEFWHGDPYLCVYYREADLYRFERENRHMWLQGMYIHEAVAKAIGITFAPKGKKVEPYTQYPYACTERELQAEKERKMRHTLEWVKEGIERSETNG